MSVYVGIDVHRKRSQVAVIVAIPPGPVRCERLAGCDRDVARRAGWIFTEDH